jgi:hypothetical protein
MTEVNENIVRTYYETKGYFTQANVKYMKSARETGKKSSGRGDIDIIGFNPISKEGIVVEIKGWHTEKFTKSYEKSDRIKSYFESMYLIRRKAKELLGNYPFKIVLIAPRFNKDFENIAKSNGVDEVIGFDKILRELLTSIKKEYPYVNETEQIMRLLKLYGFLR